MLTLKSNKLLGVLAVSMLSLMLFASVSYAGNAKSLDEIASGRSNSGGSSVVAEEVVEENSADRDNGLDANSNAFIQTINATTDMTKENRLDNDLVRGASGITAKVVQLIIFLISLGVILLVVVDVAFILFAPLRGLLCPSMAGGMNQAGGGMGGMSGGMGGMPGGMGMGGMSGGYGRMGGYSRMGGMGGMSGGMGRMGGMNPVAGRGGSQLVSDAAVQAVMMAQQGGNPLTIYAKSMAITIVLAMVLCILAATGVLNTLGLTLGVKLSEIIANITRGIV